MSGRGLNERELGEFADDLARRGRVTAPAALRTQLRASLLAAPVSPRRQPSTWSRLGALRPALALVVVFALLAAGSGSAAASSLPGDPAFALKRAVEDVQVALAPDDATRLDTLVAQSNRRLADLQTAAAVRATAIAPATDEYLAAVARVDGTLSSVLTAPATPARDAAIGRASAASAEHIAMLQTLAARLPAAAQPGIQRAIEAQQAVHGKSGSAPGRPDLPGNGNGGAPGRPSDLPVPSGRGGPPSGVPGRP
jgi:hypothetical protein